MYLLREQFKKNATCFFKNYAPPTKKKFTAVATFILKFVWFLMSTAMAPW